MNSEQSMPLDRVAYRLREAGMPTDQMIDVHEGSKGTDDHTTFPPSEVNGDYGVYAEDGLVVLDIDNYDLNDDADGLEAILSLPETFSVQSPHTDGEEGGHRYYYVSGDVVEVLRDEFGTQGNLSLSWGEVRACNQYVVGPGSQLDGCSKDQCNKCAEPEGGYYTIARDIPIATISASELVDALHADPKCSRRSQGQEPHDPSGVEVPEPKEDDGARMEAAIGEFMSHSETTNRARNHLTHLLRGRYPAAGFEDDRSAAELHFVSLLYGILEEAGETDRASALIYAYITGCCENWPMVDYDKSDDEGEDEEDNKSRKKIPRKWAQRGDQYRSATIAAGIEGFEQEYWNKWKRKKYETKSWTDDYSDITYDVLLRATHQLAEQGYPRKQEVVDKAQQLDPDRARATHDEALKRLRREHGQVKMAYLGGNKYVYYPASKEDPQGAERIKCNGEVGEP